jgi:hypothetical protein
MYDLRFPQRWLCRKRSSGILHHVFLVRTDISEELIASISQGRWIAMTVYEQVSTNGRTVIFTKHVMFHMADLCFGWFKYIYCSVLSCWKLSSMIGNYDKGILIKKELYCTLLSILFCTFFKSCWHVVFICFQLTLPIVPV